ncbi:MAG: LamG-like jellyroll fold domain-containing protein [Candidatus Micrarchaeia archaeon]
MDMNKVRGQIAFEFLIIYSLAFVMFMVLFGVVSSQQSTITNDQDYLFLQQISQNVAQELSIAQSSGNGFHASFPISSTIYNLPYSLWISNSGAVIARMDINGYIINAISFSGAKALNINGQVIQSQGKTYVYNISLSSGSLNISNYDGVLYIDSPSISSLGQPSSYSYSNYGSYAANFTGGTYAYAPLGSYFGSNNPVSVVVWVYSAPNTNGPIFGISNLPKAGTSSTCFLSENGINVYGGIGSSVVSNVVNQGWNMLAIAYNSSASKVTFYVNAQKIGSTSATYSPVGQQAFWTTNLTGTLPKNVNSIFSGVLANVQVYPSVLNQQNISNLYAEGLASAPISNAISWWPLNGNLNDYSSNNHNAFSSKPMIYDELMTFTFHILNRNALNASPSLVGIITPSNGFFNGYIPYASSYTNLSGVTTLSWLSSNSVPNSNASIYIFPSNASLLPNLVGWWPLIYTKYIPSAVYDLSGRYDNPGSFSTPAWSSFQGNLTPLISASFNGASSLITFSNITNPAKPLTATAWFKTTSYGVILWNGNTNQPGSATAYSPILYVCNNGNICGGDYPAQFDINQKVNDGKWHFAALVQSKNNEYLYLDGKLIGSYSTTPQSFYPYYWSIGEGYSTGWPTTYGNDYFNGNISDLQIYNTNLSSSAIYNLYKAGPYDTPLNPQNLSGWFLLNGNFADYSSNNNTGNAKNVNFAYNLYNSLEQAENFTIPYFSSSNYITIPYSSNFNSPNFGASVWFRVSSFTGNNQYIYQLPGMVSLYINPTGNLIASFPAKSLQFSGPSGSSTGIKLGKWYNVILIDNSNYCYTYLNGMLENYSTCSPGSATGGSLVIGRGFNGNIINMQLYNTALSLQEIEQIYASQLPFYIFQNVVFGGI